MLQISKVLYPTDFSMCSRKALDYAMFFAEHFEAELQILHVNTLHEQSVTDSALSLKWPETLLARAQELADSELGQLLEAHQERALEVREFKKRALFAGPAILEHAEAQDVDLIVMGTHGNRGFKRALLGSVAEEVIRHASCPVLALREDGRRQGLTAIERIFVPIDFSEHSRAAFDQAVGMAQQYGSTLQLAHIINRLPVPAFYSNTIGTFEMKHYKEVRQASLEQLQQWAEGVPDVNFTFHVEIGETTGQLTEMANELESDCILLATHGLTGLKHWLMGSTTERVLRYAECPVLIVKSFGKSLLASD